MNITKDELNALVERAQVLNFQGMSLSAAAWHAAAERGFSGAERVLAVNVTIAEFNIRASRNAHGKERRRLKKTAKNARRRAQGKV